MIVRPFTFLTGLLFALSGAYLFVVKHQSQALEDRLEQVAETSRQDEQAIRVLEAQWALEADPSRIASLAAQFTGLQPMKPGQLVTLASLASSLPAPGSAAPFSNPEDVVPAIPGAGNVPTAPSGPPIEVRGHVADAQKASGIAMASAVPAKPAVVNEQVADNAVPAVKPVEHRQVRPRITEPHARLASADIVPHPTPLVRARPVAAHPARPPSALYVASASAIAPAPLAPRQERAQPMGAQVVRVRATAEPVVDAPPAMASGGGSLLGMAQTGSQN